MQEALAQRGKTHTRKDDWQKNVKEECAETEEACMGKRHGLMNTSISEPTSKRPRAGCGSPSGRISPEFGGAFGKGRDRERKSVVGKDTRTRSWSGPHLRK